VVGLVVFMMERGKVEVEEFMDEGDVVVTFLTFDEPMAHSRKVTRVQDFDDGVFTLEKPLALGHGLGISHLPLAGYTKLNSPVLEEERPLPVDELFVEFCFKVLIFHRYLIPLLLTISQYFLP
jgi:hypothetical protein